MEASSSPCSCWLLLPLSCSQLALALEVLIQIDSSSVIAFGITVIVLQQQVQVIIIFLPSKNIIICKQEVIAVGFFLLPGSVNCSLHVPGYSNWRRADFAFTLQLDLIQCSKHLSITRSLK